MTVDLRVAPTLKLSTAEMKALRNIAATSSYRKRSAVWTAPCYPDIKVGLVFRLAEAGVVSTWSAGSRVQISNYGRAVLEHAARPKRDVAPKG
jgi:hypothetical protein